ncbi:MAG: AmmeMemoRadiSam system protein B, partial [Planctomycetota bacterium]
PRALRRLIAPHIDLGLGADAHAGARAALQAGGRPDVAVVLGVCHGPSEERFIACRKDFATPLGTLPHDAGLLDRLERRLGRDPTRGQLVHRSEHSVEFQALWLAHLWPDDPPAIVPFLVGSFEEFVRGGRRPAEDPEVTAFCEALRETVAEDGREVVVVASVDLAHVGPRYGDPEGLDETGEARLEAQDRGVLDRIVAGDAGGFFDEIARSRNANRHCGVAPIYVVLELGEGAGRLVRYGQGRIDPPTGSVVSFAAVAFER